MAATGNLLKRFETLSEPPASPWYPLQSLKHISKTLLSLSETLWFTQNASSEFIRNPLDPRLHELFGEWCIGKINLLGVKGRSNTTPRRLLGGGEVRPKYTYMILQPVSDTFCCLCPRFTGKRDLSLLVLSAGSVCGRLKIFFFSITQQPLVPREIRGFRGVLGVFRTLSRALCQVLLAVGGDYWKFRGISIVFRKFLEHFMGL